MIILIHYTRSYGFLTLNLWFFYYSLHSYFILPHDAHLTFIEEGLGTKYGGSCILQEFELVNVK